ncbi:hypothetical protein [Enterobacter hormaechei]|uniref:hypothetical protein n=1 Tax=Enterobacter hormaechei TaxID=158836 RepID=UPI001C9BA321|nr:hypothetical protein [Enterobacter hormaechei]MBY7159148.1 hypothetical protein [Enterobacter hormaechei]
MTANKPMTGEQLDELMTIAVNMQRDSEKVSERPAAMFAYAVQVAVLELRKVRNEAAALAEENAQMLRLLTDISENHDEYVTQDEYLYAGIPMDYVSEINSYVSRDVEAENPFKATDAFLAEVRAQGVERLANAWYAIANETDPGISISDSSRLKYRQRADDAADFANEIRQEAAK